MEHIGRPNAIANRAYFWVAVGLGRSFLFPAEGATMLRRFTEATTFRGSIESPCTLANDKQKKKVSAAHFLFVILVRVGYLAACRVLGLVLGFQIPHGKPCE
jgi:hypothetical protein